jgi:hypothetical protein
MENEAYFKNLDQIEEAWRVLKKEQFPVIKKDDFWRLCQKGRELFWTMALEFKKNGYSMPKSVPAFERAIMLLEHENRIRDAIRLCEEAIEWKINTDWYSVRLRVMKNKVDNNEDR